MFKNFLTEIKARKIRKWFTIHISTSITIIGVVNVISSRYNFPPEIFDSILAIAICSLPITLVIAWFHSPEERQAFKSGEIIFYSVMIGITVFILVRINLFRSEEAVENIEKSIAVLPFQNFSDLKDDEYFSDGITEDIITHLSKIKMLNVISRTSVMKYKDVKKSIREIAIELGVESVLEGSVRRAGDRVRIVSQLIDARNDKHLWAETYDRRITDIFEIQSEVAEKIAGALAVNLTNKEKERIQKKYTDNINAYTFYLKGREYYKKLTFEDNEKAVEFYKKALNEDEDYTLAYAGLGEAYAQKFRIFGMGNEYYDTSKIMSETAMELDPDIAEPYLALGLTLFYKGKISAALMQYLKAADINPNAEVVSSIGQVYNLLGNYFEAIPWLKQSLILDPSGWLGYRNLGQVYYGLGRYDEAEKLFFKVLELMPGHTYVLSDLTRLYIIQKKFDRADSLLRSLLKNNPDNARALYCLGEMNLFAGNLNESRKYFQMTVNITTLQYGPAVEYAYFLWKAGKEKEASEIFSLLIEENELEIKDGMENHNYPYELARIYSIKGNTDKAIENLKHAVSYGWKYYLYTKADPLLENIRNDSRFILLMNEIKSDVDNMLVKIKQPL